MNASKCAPLVLMLGCGLTSPERPPEMIAQITLDDEQRVQITIPDTVRRGSRFNVDVRTTFCEREPSSTRVTIDRLAATVTPYNRILNRGFDCPGFHTGVAYHTTWLRFDEVGLARVVVVGLNARRDTIRVSRFVVIR